MRNVLAHYRMNPTKLLYKILDDKFTYHIARSQEFNHPAEANLTTLRTELRNLIAAKYPEWASTQRELRNHLPKAQTHQA